MKRITFTCAVVLSVFALLVANVMASQTIHYEQDFTDGNITGGVGSLNNIDAALALHNQQAWRNSSLTYFGLNPAVAFDGAGGFGTAKQFRVTTANNAVLQSGNVWVLDMSVISDVATTGSQFFSGSPGPMVEWDWLTANDFTFSSSSVSKLGPAVSNGSNAEGSILATAYPNGADPNVEPTALGNSLSDAGLPAALNGTLRAKFVYQSIAGGATRASTQALNGNTPIGSAAHNDGGAGTFRSDYTGGLFAQMMGGSGGGNVTYSSGHGGGSDVAYNPAHTNLELGLTHMTFKQVRQSDFNTDGVVNVSGDGSKLVANLGLSGKSFFDGDADGDGLVNVSGDGSKLVAQLGTDILGSGQGLAEYNPATGQVLISTNGAGFIEINSSLSQLIGANAVPTNTAGLNALISDPFTSSVVNYLNFSPLGTAGILDDFSIGAILPTGISDPSGFVPGAQFRWSVVGGGEFSGPVVIIPEPGSVILAGFAGLGLVVAVRRRRRSLAK